MTNSVHYEAIPRQDDSWRVKVTGRMPRKGKHQMAINLPMELHERLVNHTSGAVSNSIVGLVMFALDELESQKKGLSLRLSY